MPRSKDWVSMEALEREMEQRGMPVQVFLSRLQKGTHRIHRTTQPVVTGMMYNSMLGYGCKEYDYEVTIMTPTECPDTAELCGPCFDPAKLKAW